MSINFLYLPRETQTHHASILFPFNLHREIEQEHYSFEDEIFEATDEGFNFFIPQKSDLTQRTSSNNSEIVNTAQNDKYVSFLHFSEEKKYEVSIMENTNIENDKIKLKTIAYIELPQLEIQIIDEKDKEKLVLERQSTTNLIKIQGNSQSQSMIMETSRNIIHPKIYHCAETYLLIDTVNLIYLLNFKNNKISILLTKKKPQQLNVIYTYNEKYCKENNIEEIKTRTFIFCTNEMEELFYFTLEDGYFEKNNSEIIISKLQFSQYFTKDLKIMKIDHPDEENNTFSYLIVVLRENGISFYLSQYMNASLAFVLLRFRAYVNKRLIYWNNIDLNIDMKNRNKKIFAFYSKVKKCSIVIMNGYDVLMTEFENNMDLYELRQKFRLKEGGGMNFLQIIGNYYANNSDETWLENELNIKNILLGKGRTREAISKKYLQFRNDEFYFDNLAIYDIDYSNYSLLFQRGKLFVISRDKIFVLDSKLEMKNSKIFHYDLKKDEFVNFITFMYGINIYIASKRSVLKFRYSTKFKSFRDALNKMSDLEESSINERNNSDHYHISYKDLMQNLESKPNFFSFDEFDKFFRNKVDFLYTELLNPNEKFKASCKDPDSLIICEKCELFNFEENCYHLEWKFFHFFECSVINFLKDMKNYKGEEYTQECIKKLVRATENILFEIFKNVKDSTDYKEHLIFISLILELFDKIGIHPFIKNVLKILDILPQNQQQAKLALQLNKILLVEVTFFYFNLKLLYIKFHFDSGSLKNAGYFINNFREMLSYLRKDNRSGIDLQKNMNQPQTSRSFNLAGEKMTIKVDRALLSDALLIYLKNNMYITSNITINHTQSGMNNNSSASFFNQNAQAAHSSNNQYGQNDNNYDREIEIKIFDKFLIYYIEIKSTFMKYYLKIGRSKDLNTCFFLEDIVSNFEDRFTENSINLCYVYFYSSLYLVHINKISTAVAVLTRAYQIANKEENNNFEMSVSCLYNLGILYSALGAYSEGIHHLEEAHRLIVSKNMSTQLLMQVLQTLSLAYINRKSNRKAFTLIQQCISMINLKNSDEPNHELIRLQSYMNYIIDLIEYDFNTIKKNRNWSVTDMVRNKELELKKESMFLIDYVLNNGIDLNRQIFEIYSEGFVEVLDFLYNCSTEQLAILNADNNQKEISQGAANNDNNAKDKLDTTAINNNNNTTATDVTHRDLNQSNILAQNPKDNNQYITLTRDKIVDTMDLREEIEIKKPFLNSLSISKQEVLKNLNSNLFKRILILRDPKGVIDHFNLNFHPIHTRSLQKIVENIRSNFLIKEVTLNHMRNPKDDEDFNYEINSYLYGLANYLKRPNIKHMLTLEKFRKLSMPVENESLVKKSMIDPTKISSDINKLATGISIKTSIDPANATAAITTKPARKIKFTEFINIADKIDIDKEEANDFLYDIYSNFDDDYCIHLIENPHILLNFIYNETKLFQPRQNAEKGSNKKRRKKSNQMSDLEEDSFEEDGGDSIQSGSELSQKSLKRKNNIYNKFMDENAKEDVKNISRDNLIQKIYTGKEGNSMNNLSNNKDLNDSASVKKVEMFKSEEENVVKKSLFSMSLVNLGVNRMKIQSDTEENNDQNKLKAQNINSKSDGEVNLMNVVKTVNIISNKMNSIIEKRKPNERQKSNTQSAEDSSIIQAEKKKSIDLLADESSDKNLNTSSQILSQSSNILTRKDEENQLGNNTIGNNMNKNSISSTLAKETNIAPRLQLGIEGDIQERESENNDTMSKVESRKSDKNEDANHKPDWLTENLENNEKDLSHTDNNKGVKSPKTIKEILKSKKRRKSRNKSPSKNQIRKSELNDNFALDENVLDKSQSSSSSSSSKSDSENFLSKFYNKKEITPSKQNIFQRAMKRPSVQRTSKVPNTFLLNALNFKRKTSIKESDVKLFKQMEENPPMRKIDETRKKISNTSKVTKNLNELFKRNTIAYQKNTLKRHDSSSIINSLDRNTHSLIKHSLIDSENRSKIQQEKGNDSTVKLGAENFEGEIFKSEVDSNFGSNNPNPNADKDKVEENLENKIYGLMHKESIKNLEFSVKNMQLFDRFKRKLSRKIDTQNYIAFSDSKDRQNMQMNPSEYFTSKYSEMMITEYLYKKNKKQQKIDKTEMENNNQNKRTSTMSNVIEKLKKTNLNPNKGKNLFTELYKTNIKRMADKNLWKEMKTKENNEDEEEFDIHSDSVVDEMISNMHYIDNNEKSFEEINVQPEKSRLEENSASIFINNKYKTKDYSSNEMDSIVNFKNSEYDQSDFFKEKKNKINNVNPNLSNSNINRNIYSNLNPDTTSRKISEDKKPELNVPRYADDSLSKSKSFLTDMKNLSRVNPNEEKSILSEYKHLISKAPPVPKLGIPAVPGVPTIPAVPNPVNSTKIPEANLKSNIPLPPSSLLVPKRGDSPSMIPGIPSAPPKLNNSLAPQINPPSFNNSLNNSKLQKEKIKTSVNLKQLNWNTIEPTKIQNTVWEKIDDSSIISKIKETKLEEDFAANLNNFENKINLNKQNTNNNNKSTNSISILSTQRQQNVNLILSKLKSSPDKIFNSVLNYDTTTLNQEKCELILSILPNESEIKQFKSFSGDFHQLTECDKFIFFLVDKVPYYDLRLRSLVLKNNYQGYFKDLDLKLKQIRNNFKFFLNDQRITEWLQIILAYGNYLNGNTNKGGAFAFRLNTLNKLTEIKSNDNKKTLLHFVIQMIIEQKKFNLLDLNFNENEISKLDGLHSIKESFAEIKKEFLPVKKLVELTVNTKNNSADFKTAEILKEFYNDLYEKIVSKERLVNSLDSEYEKVCKFYGENPKDLPYEQFLEIFVKFFSDIKITKSEILKKNSQQTKIIATVKKR